MGNDHELDAHLAGEYQQQLPQSGLELCGNKAEGFVQNQQPPQGRPGKDEAGQPQSEGCHINSTSSGGSHGIDVQAVPPEDQFRFCLPAFTLEHNPELVGGIEHGLQTPAHYSPDTFVGGLLDSEGHLLYDPLSFIRVHSSFRTSIDLMAFFRD